MVLIPSITRGCYGIKKLVIEMYHCDMSNRRPGGTSRNICIVSMPMAYLFIPRISLASARTGSFL